MLCTWKKVPTREALVKNSQFQRWPCGDLSEPLGWFLGWVLTHPHLLCGPPAPLPLAEPLGPQLRLPGLYTWDICLSGPQVSFLLIPKNKNNGNILSMSPDRHSQLKFSSGCAIERCLHQSRWQTQHQPPSASVNQRRKRSQQPKEATSSPVQPVPGAPLLPSLPLGHCGRT